MWESPVYSFNVPVGTDPSGNRLYKQVVVDVTRSAPPFDRPGKTLSKVLDVALSASGVTKKALILDFGAGKLRNAIHLLTSGYRVCGVEFRQLFDDSDQASSALDQATRYRKRFSRLVFPHEFIDSSKRFDFVLLVNVLNIMPVPAERLAVLKLCHERLKSGGHLLWYTQRGDRTYVKRMVPKFQVGDGYYIGLNARLKTFYREFTVQEIDQMLAASGFELVKPIDATPRNQARLYLRAKSAAVQGVLEASRIDDARVTDEHIPRPTAVKPRLVKSLRSIRRGDPNPPSLAVPALYRTKLSQIAVGKASATIYQEHVKAMLELLFRKELRQFKLEEEIFEGRKRLDIIARNKSQDGFFHSLKSDQQLRCPYIVIECKNYRDDPTNPEFDQLSGRLGNKLRTQVGILAYRSSQRRALTIRRCADHFVNDRKLLIPLSDGDFEELLKLKQDGNDEGIEDHLDAIVQEILTT